MDFGIHMEADIEWTCRFFLSLQKCHFVQLWWFFARVLFTSQRIFDPFPELIAWSVARHCCRVAGGLFVLRVSPWPSLSKSRGRDELSKMFAETTHAKNWMFESSEEISSFRAEANRKCTQKLAARRQVCSNCTHRLWMKEQKVFLNYKGSLISSLFLKTLTRNAGFWPCEVNVWCWQLPWSYSLSAWKNFRPQLQLAVEVFLMAIISTRGCWKLRFYLTRTTLFTCF
jgi:hypothetical protein